MIENLTLKFTHILVCSVMINLNELTENIIFKMNEH